MGGCSRRMRARRRGASGGSGRRSSTSKKLLEAGSDIENSSAGAADAPPAKRSAVRVAGLDYVTTAWLKQHAPEIVSLRVSEPEDLDGVPGGKQRVLTAVVECYDWDDDAGRVAGCFRDDDWWEDVGAALERVEEEREEVLVTHDDGEGSTNREREQSALLRLVKQDREETVRAVERAADIARGTAAGCWARAERAKPPVWELHWQKNCDCRGWFATDEERSYFKGHANYGKPTPDEVIARGDAARKAKGWVKGWWVWKGLVDGREERRGGDRPTPTERELSRYAELQELAREAEKWERDFACKCDLVLRRCAAANEARGRGSGKQKRVEQPPPPPPPPRCAFCAKEWTGVRAGGAFVCAWCGHGVWRVAGELATATHE